MAIQMRVRSSTKNNSPTALATKLDLLITQYPTLLNKVWLAVDVRTNLPKASRRGTYVLLVDDSPEVIRRLQHALPLCGIRLLPL